MSRIKRRGGNVFEIFGGGGGNSGDGDTPIDRRIYRAYDVEKIGAYKGQEEWLYIEFGPTNEPAHMIRYDQIQRIFGHGTNGVTLALKDEGFSFYGQRVDQLLLPIQDRRLRSIYLFVPDFHQEPPASDAKIVEIEHHTRQKIEQEKRQREG